MTDEHVFPDPEDAAERYLLGQMSDADRDKYEQHFFSCAACAEEVKATARLMDTCQQVLNGPAAVASIASRPKRHAWFPRASVGIVSGALAATLALVAYQNVVTIPSLRQSATPRALTAFSFVAFNTRGAADRTIAAPRNQPFLIYFDIPPGQQAVRYEGRILAEDGRIVATTDVSEKQAQESVPFMIPAGQLAPGSYTLVVTARTDGSKPPAELARFPFTLRFAD
jgi:hypothetical protein